MGGSGLIVVVIVAAWAVFLVPQWLHRRAEAAAHLADRVPDDVLDAPDAAPTAETELEDEPARPPQRRRFGRRLLVRASRDGASSGRPALDRPVARSAAARRRRVLAVLAGATLLSAAMTVLATLLGASAPGWIVAVPGGLMAGYLMLLAVVRPSAAPAVAGRATSPATEASRRPRAAAATVHDAQAEPAETGPLDGQVEHDAVGTGAALPAADGTWTPVPVPVPTYVTAPKARRVVRTIDLSNPGSWTSASAHGAVPAGAADDTSAAPPDDVNGSSDEVGVLPVRRAVGD